MNTRLLALLNVRSGEEPLTGLLFLYAFVIGLSRIFLVPSQALFLAAYGADNLAWGYLAGSAAIPILSAAMLWIGQALGPMAVVLMNLGVTAGITLFFYGSALTSTGHWPTVGLFAWNLAAYTMSGLAFWGVAGKLLDVRQGKRLFPLVSTGDVLAHVVGGLAIGPLSGFVGTLHVIALSAVGSLAAMVLAVYFSQTWPAPFADGADQAGKGRHREPADDTFTLFKSRYVLLIGAYFLASGFDYIFVDNAFNAEAASWFGAGNTVGLARFFGAYAATTAILELLFRSFAAGRVLDRLGLGAGLATLPAAIAVGAGLVSAAGFLVGSAGLVFVLMTLMSVADRFFRGVQNAALATAYQPLLRSATRVQTVMEGMIDPLAFSTASLSLLVFKTRGIVSAPFLCLILFPICLLWLVICVLLRRDYTERLQEAVQRRQLPVDENQASGPEARSLLADRITNGSPDERLYSLQLLQASEHDAYKTALVQLVAIEEGDLLLEILRRIESARLADAREPMRARLIASRQPLVRGAIVQTLCALGDDQDIASGIAYLRSEDPAAVDGAMIGLLASGSMEGVIEAGARLMALGRSTDPVDRTRVGSVLARAGGLTLPHAVRALLADVDLRVCAAGLRAAAAGPHPSLWPDVLALLFKPDLTDLAEAALRKGGDESVAAIARALEADTRHPFQRARLVRLAGSIGGENAGRLLMSYVHDGDGRVRGAVYEGLVRAAEQPNEHVHRALEREIRLAADLVVSAADLAADPSCDLLQQALIEAARAVAARILTLLKLVTDRVMIEKVQAALGGENPARRAFAVELLDAATDKALGRRLVPLFEDLSISERADRLRAVTRFPQGDARQVVSRLLGDLQPDIDDWTRITVLLAAGSMRNGDGARLIEHSSPYVAETARWANGQSFGGASPAVPAVVMTIEILAKSNILGTLPRQRLLELLPETTEVELPARSVLLSEGDPSNDLYVILEGELEVVGSGNPTVRFGRGGMIGEFGALMGSPRTATLKAASDTRLLRLECSDFLRVLAENPSIAINLARQTAARLMTGTKVTAVAQVSQLQPLPDAAPQHLATIFLLRRTKLFGSLSPELLAGIVDRFEEVVVTPGQQIIRQGELGDRLFVIMSGRVEVRSGDAFLGYLGAGDVFGERALLLDEPRVATVVAADACTLLTLDRDMFLQLLSDNFASVRGLISGILLLYGHATPVEPTQGTNRVRYTQRDTGQ